MWQQPFSNRFEIRREITLGHRGTVASVWPKRLVGLADGYSQNAHGRPSRRSLRGARPGVSDRARGLGSNFVCRLVLAQALERRLPHHSVAGPSCEFDLRHQFGLYPVNLLTARWSAFAREGTLGCLGCLQFWYDALHDTRAVAGSHYAGVNETIPLVHAHHQRAEFSCRCSPAADDDFLPRAAFCLHPTVASVGMICRA